MGKLIYTVRVTVLETLRQFLYNQTEQNETYNTEANLIASIKGIREVNVKADYGSAGHKIIEFPKQNTIEGGYQIDKFTFTWSQVRPLWDYIDEHPLMIREIALAKLYHCRDFDLIITGTCDALEGNIVRDNKFKFGQIDMQDYMDSIQHRLYLDMLGLRDFYYDFFRVAKFETIADCDKAVISPVESLYVGGYPDMQQDIQSLLTDFEDFVTFKSLLPYLAVTPDKRKRIAAGNSGLLKLI